MDSIRPVNLAAIDLNLVRVLHALLEERAVTAAGRRVGLSQPATSNALRRLRALFGDPLLVRGPRGLELTAYGRELRAPVAAAIEALGRAFAPPARFEPATAPVTWRLAATDLSAVTLVPELRRILAREAPAADLVLRSGERDQVLGWLADDVVDLAVGVFRERPVEIEATPLFDERMVLVVHERHPLLTGPLSAERLAAFPAILVSPRGDPQGVVDDALAARGLRRRVALTVPHFLLAPFLLHGSELTLVYPSRLAELLAAPLGLAVLPEPLGLPSFTSQLLWARRNARHPPLVWLRDAVRRAVAAQGALSRSW